MAEREGFEPSRQLITVYSLSRRAPSAYSAISPYHRSVSQTLSSIFGGGGGIRTHGTRKGSTVFKTASLNRSDTPPWKGCYTLQFNANESIAQAPNVVNQAIDAHLLPFYYFYATHIRP